MAGGQEFWWVSGLLAQFNRNIISINNLYIDVRDFHKGIEKCSEAHASIHITYVVC